MISYKHNFIFVHIPKCAGTSIENYLVPLEGKHDPREIFLPYSHYVPGEHGPYKKPFEVPQHYTLQSIKDILYSRGESDFYNNAFKFSVVRNPWDRMVSEMSFFTKIFNTKHSIQGLCSTEHVSNHRFDINQVDFLTVEGKIDVDKVIKFENVQNGFTEILKKLKLPFSKEGGMLGRAEASNHEHYSKYYDSETRELVAEKYSKDIEYFNNEYQVSF